MKLTAVSMDDPQRMVRFLTGALVACGGWVLTRSVSERESAEISFEFARACCVEIYAVLIAAGLELSRDAHLRMTELCHCTKNLIDTKAFDIARITMTVYTQEPVPGDTPKGGGDQPQIA